MVKWPAVSIIIPLYNPDLNILNDIESSISRQDYKGKVEVIKVDKGLGLADSINYGIKKSKNKIIITLHQDCVPSSKDWLANLVKPLSDRSVVCSVSKVELPHDYWKSFSFFVRIMSIKEQKVITPLMDEKGCVFRKKDLIKVGLFDGKTFRTAGEDFDMAIKLSKLGKIVHPKSKVLHYHQHTFLNRLHKEYQLSNAFGVIIRLYENKIPKRYVSFFKSVPFLGWLILLSQFPYLRMPLGGIFWIPLALGINFIYCFGFWKGFLRGKQSV